MFDETAGLSLKMSAETCSPLLHRDTTVNNAEFSLSMCSVVCKVH